MRQRCLVSLVLVLVMSPVTHAMWFDTFAGGTPQQTWVYAALPDGFAYTQSYFSDGVQIESTVPVGTGGAAAVFGVVPDMFDSNVRVRAVVNPNNVSDLWLNMGVLAHMNPATASGYSFTVKYGSSHSIDISKVTGGEVDGLISEGIPDFSPTDTYVLELDVIGTHLIGRVYDSNENLLTTISAIDNDPYTSGYAGIVTQREPEDPTTLLGMFGMVSAIPEPSSFLLVVLAVLAWSLHRRNRLWMKA